MSTTILPVWLEIIRTLYQTGATGFELNNGFRKVLMNVTKNDPKLGRYFVSTEQIIAWLGRQFVNRTFEEEDDDTEVDVAAIREFLGDDDDRTGMGT